MAYSINEQFNQATGKADHIVIDSSGRLVPSPYTFSTRSAALARIVDLEREDAMKLATQLNARQPAVGQCCYGKIVGASDTLLIQHLGRDQYVLHQRADSEAFEDIEIGDLVRIVDGDVEYPSRKRSSGLSL